MKKTLALTFGLSAWIAVIWQYFIMINNSDLPLLGATFRFFSFFTILTNTLVAIYFTMQLLPKSREKKFIKTPGTLTAIAVYIAIVGIVYQIALRHIWHPVGAQRIVDEMLHSVNPILVIAFWYMYESVKSVSYAAPIKWSIYPLIYLAFILIRGQFTADYPYYFVDAQKLGMTTVLINSGIILVLFVAISYLFLFVGKRLWRR